MNPAGVAWSPRNELIVADAGNGRLEAFDAVGHLIWATSPTPSDPAYLVRPRGIDVAQDGTIAVVDSDPSRPPIVYFAPDGTYAGQTNQSVGFLQPYGASYDAAGNLWVADRGGNQLFKLRPPDTVVAQYGTFGPEGLSVSPVDVRWTPSVLLMLDFSGQQLLSIPNAVLP